MTRRPLDPHKVNVLFDSNAFDGVGPDDPDVDRLVELDRAQKIRLITPWSVRTELADAHTPAHVRQATEPLIFSYIVEQNPVERQLYQRVRDIL